MSGLTRLGPIHRRMANVWALGLWIALSLASPSDSRAQVSERDARARGHFEAGASYMESHNYEDALREFQQAYQLSPRPRLLYNIGVAAQYAGDHLRAIEAYEAFVASGGAGELQGEIDERLAQVRAAMEAERAAQSPPVAATEPKAVEPAPDTDATDESPAREPAEAAAGSQAWPKWIVVGSGGALVVAGATLFALGAKDVSTVEGAERGSNWTDVEDAYARSPTRTLVGGLLLGIGAAAAAGGLVWWALTKEDEPAATAVRISPTANGVLVMGRF